MTPESTIANELSRFLAKVERQPNGCLRWTAGVTKQGYGGFHPSKKVMVLAHRYAFEFFVRPLAPGETVDHTCHNADPTCMGGRTCVHRRCVEPTHLDATDGGTNLRRSHRWNGNKSACPHGHLYSPENVYINGRGGRICRECARERDRQPNRLSSYRRRVYAERKTG
jgi:hypothetical protein